MKAIVIHEYGGPEVLKFEDYADPAVGEGQVLVRVAAAGINPADIGRRSGRMKDILPIKFPGIIGADVSGTIEKLGAGVKGFSVGDKVFAYADRTYAELCAVPATRISVDRAGRHKVWPAGLRERRGGQRWTLGGLQSKKPGRGGHCRCLENAGAAGGQPWRGSSHRNR